ncbi:hypothetical protein EJB05_37229, partial [Eragrostis curvula]
MAAAMTLVVGGFLSAVVDGTAAKAFACLESNYDMPERARELLRELETRLTVVKAISEAADNRLITNVNLVQWLKRLHKAAQEAEDALDEFEVDEVSITGKRKVSEFIVSSLRSLKSMVIPDKSMEKLEHVVKTLTHLCASSATFVELLKMEDSKANNQQAGVVAESTSLLPLDVHVFGRDEVKEYILKILCSFNGYENTGFDNGDSMEATITKLRSKLRGRFLLVLDNIWAEMCQEWSTLLTALLDEARQYGSVILITTQSQRFAQIISTIDPINLKSLPWESFWPLFQYHAFGGVEVAQEEDNKNMRLIGEVIARKLDGLPLAAKVIGNLLRCRFSRDSWIRVAESDWWSMGEALLGVLPYLRVSYQHLAPKQRQCFAFCSIFPRNYLFDKDRMVQMWIAHDFIHRDDVKDGMRLEDVGKQCFDELVDRSEDASSVAPENVRHLALQTGSLEQCQELHKYKNLRTLLLFGRFESDAVFSILDGILGNSPSLRVLDLSFIEAPVKGWPNDSKGLRKLRFLDLSFTRIGRLKDFPSNLQVLHLRGYDADCFPQSIIKLAHLRHLVVDDSALSKIQGIGRLTELQELDSFIARKGQGFMIRELKNMRELRGQLCIRGIENVRSKEEAMEAGLMDKKHLDALVIEGRKVPKFALEGLQPHPNVKELTIKFYQDQAFPDWMLQPDNLANLLHVNLESCRSLSTLPPLGHLPLLKHLCLRKLPSVKHVSGTSFGFFPYLEELEFHWMEQWEEWTEPDTATAESYAPGSSLFLRHLKKLHLESCLSLRQLPRLPFLSALRELKISKPGNYILALPTCFQVLAYLTTLKIEYCHHRVVLSAHQFKTLENLELIKSEGIRLADGFQGFRNLRSARVEGCPQLLSATASSISAGCGKESNENQQQGANKLTNLRTDDSLMTGDYFRAMGNLPSLRDLFIINVPNVTHFSEEQEIWFRQLTSLESLCIVSFYALRRLPSSLATRPSIKKLELCSLHNLHSLSDVTLPPELQELRISNCSVLLTRVSKDGADWPKIVHVPYIHVDGTTIQNI